MFLKDRLVGTFRVVPIALALLVPAALYLALFLARPLQYRFVVEDAAVRGWPLACAVLALAAFAALAFWVLRACERLTPSLALLACATLAGAAATGFAFGRQPVPALVPAAAAGLLLFCWYRLLRSERLWGRLPRPFRSTWLPAVLALGLYLGSAVASILDPLRLPQAVGAFAILAVFAGFLGLLLCVAMLRPRAGLAFLLYGLVAALFFGSNSHRVPTVEAKTAPMEMRDSFSLWLRNRADLEAYRSANLPYPVIFVSSEGGGIYAAAHAYGVLSTLARHCPTFSQHVFAAVGVSGGALGNALFAGALDARQKRHAPCRPEALPVDPEPVAADHLSPVLARFLLVEPMDRLLPGRWAKRDRAQVLTDSFLSVAGGKDYLRTAITDSFNPAGARPALMSVSVDVASGRRLVMAPFWPMATQGTAMWWPSNGRYETQQAVPHPSLIDAAGVSARFPWITPTGRLSVGRGKDLVLADGGYFDNSGADTILDLINDLRISDNAQRVYKKQMEEEVRLNGPIKGSDECTEKAVRVVRNFAMKSAWGDCEIPVFIIHFAIASHEGFDEAPAAAPAVEQSFLLDPIKALLATRQSRAEIALQRADLEQCGTLEAGTECTAQPDASLGLFRNDIAPLKWKLPLGWYMSGGMFDRMLKETVPRAAVDYRRLRDQRESGIRFLVYHLDPDLHKEGADPAIGDLMPAS